MYIYIYTSHPSDEADELCNEKSCREQSVNKEELLSSGRSAAASSPGTYLLETG